MLRFLIAPVVLASALMAAAAPVEYRVTQQTGRATQVFSNIATVESETDFENFTARTNNVSGSLTFDREARTGSGTLAISGKALTTGVDLRDEDMRSSAWFDFNNDPTVKFVTTNVRFISGNNYRVVGDFTLHGVTKPVTARVTLKYTPAASVPKSIGVAGDVVAITAKFSIKLSDFGVTHPAIAAGRVNNQVDITLKAIASNKFAGEN